MIFPRENAGAIEIIDAGYAYADCLEGHERLAARCRGLVDGDRFLADMDGHPEVEVRRLLSKVTADQLATRRQPGGKGNF